MRTRATLAMLTLSFLAVAFPAAAQRRSSFRQVPNTDMNAVSGSIGLSTPSDPSLTSGLTLSSSTT